MGAMPIMEAPPSRPSPTFAGEGANHRVLARCINYKAIQQQKNQRKQAMNDVEYYLTEEYIELNHLLKLAGFASSGGGGSALVVQGLVTVDGKPESRKRNKIRAGQVVRYQGARIFVLAPKGS
jgi:ribosome-associated protein